MILFLSIKYLWGFRPLLFTSTSKLLLPHWPNTLSYLYKKKVLMLFIPLPTEKSAGLRPDAANTLIQTDFHNENCQLQKLQSELLVCMLISGSRLKGNWDRYLSECRVNAAFILTPLCSPPLSLTHSFPAFLLTSVLSFPVFSSMTCPSDRVGMSTLIHS